MELQQVERVLAAAADTALSEQASGRGGREKADGSVVTATDLAVQETVRTALAERWPGYAFLGEEMDAAGRSEALAHSAGTWCLDPLDGTSNYAAGLPFYCVSLALLIAGRAELGVVYDPVRRECFSARRGGGAWLNGNRLAGAQRETPLDRAVALVDFKRLDLALTTRLVQAPPYHSQRNLGAVALDWCWLAAGRGDCYLHGGQQLWDYAAGHLVFREAGGAAVTLEGAPLERGGEPGKRSAVAALDPRLLDAWAAWLGVPVQQS